MTSLERMNDAPAARPDDLAGGASMPGAAARGEHGYVDGGAEFVGGIAGRFALREMQFPSWRNQLAVMLTIGAALGFVGPYGTYLELDLAQRLLFWMMAIPLIGVPASLSQRLVHGMESIAAWPIAAKSLLGALLAGFPSTFLAVALDTLFRQMPPLTVLGLLKVYGSVTLIIALIAIPWTLIMRRRELPQARLVGGEGAVPLPPGEAPGTSPFLRRIPPRLGSELRYIATEDHYLRIVTALGSDLILFRLSDAIAELDPGLGRQVHRSYWVARQAVASVERDAHRTTLLLTDGTRVPVSRTYLKALREAGWLSV
jgi:hypothetical protein